MHLAHLRLRDFRNYARLDVDFAPGFHVLLGDNAQGKTNILEAIYLMATLRSFRGVGGAQMVRHGAEGLFRRRQSRRPGRARDQNVLVRRRAQTQPRRPAGAQADGLSRRAAHGGFLHGRFAT